jgi:uncharacterized damage-inducible protein DinB
LKSPNPTLDAIDYAISVLQQAELIAAEATTAAQINYGAEVGPHLRHIIEHFQQLIKGLVLGSVNYDIRERELSLEQDVAVLRARIAGLILALRALTSADMQATIEVFLLGRLDGSVQFSAPSTVFRELLFVISHATHHYALLTNLLRAHGVVLPPCFGKAPATAQYGAQTYLKLGAIA